MSDNSLLWLMNWYKNHCDGDWEHSYGIESSTLDKPGWFISINLNETEFDNRAFNEIQMDQSKNHWISCRVHNKIFEGRCGPLDLNEVLLIFRRWVEG